MLKSSARFVQIRCTLYKQLLDRNRYLRVTCHALVLLEIYIHRIHSYVGLVQICYTLNIKNIIFTKKLSGVVLLCNRRYRSFVGLWEYELSYRQEESALLIQRPHPTTFANKVCLPREQWLHPWRLDHKQHRSKPFSRSNYIKYL